MNFRPVLHLISFIPLVLGLALLSCWGTAEYFDDPSLARSGFAYSAGLSILTGILLWALTRGPVDLSRRDGVGIVMFGWIITVGIGALPFLFGRTITSIPSALFESVSGFTTTGASVLDNLEALPRSILLWRAITHLIGGMGILVLCVAVIPYLGVGGMQIYRAEMAGPSKDRLTPRIASTAKLLWGVYVLLNVTEIALLRVAGMSWFDSVCHAFASVATGGFSTRTVSVLAYDNLWIEIILTVFMFLGGVNFALHLRALRGDVLNFFRDPEFRLYLILIALATLVISVNTWGHPHTTAAGTVRPVLFTVVSLITTTGFSTENFDAWPALSKFVLLLLMLVGGCAGSTAGGMKNIRVLVLFKQTLREFRLFVQPQAVVQVKVGRQLVEPETVNNITAFFFVFILTFIGATACMAYFTPDLTTAVSSVAATLGNVGPGFGTVGPLLNYGSVPDGGKIVLIATMLLGRLELYTLLVVLMPSFWKR